MYSSRFEKEYSKFKDFIVHKIYMYLFDIEFNVNDFKNKGFIEEFLPLREQRIRNNIFSSFQQEKKTMVDDYLRTAIQQSAMKPFNIIAFYYGCDIALYVSFFLTRISYLLHLRLIGVAIFVPNMTINKRILKFFQTIYVNFVIFWPWHLMLNLD